jgi:hypothetical protein
MLWARAESCLAECQALTLHDVLEILLNLFLELVQIGHRFRVGEFAQILHVDDGKLCVLFCVFQLLEQLIDFLSSSRISIASGTVMDSRPVKSYFAREMIHLVFFAKRFHQADKSTGEIRISSFGAVPEIFE